MPPEAAACSHILMMPHYSSLSIEWITVILMLIGTTNFSLLLLLFRGRIRDFCKSSEMRFL